ncbi:MAG: hypothetical protein KGJ13_02685 [Patescibacteria group bacterium]|nr:hypothetical protein [Patescibacteria group bacterium]
MNKREHPCWSQKELEQIQANLRRQQIPRERVDIVPYCFRCGIRHGKREQKVIIEDGHFLCLAEFLKRLDIDPKGATPRELEANFTPYGYGQAVYPLIRYGGSYRRDSEMDSP